MTECRTVSVSIKISADQVYAFLAEPTNFPRWSAFMTAIERDEGDTWIATTPETKVRLRFCPRNAFGVLDHTVSVSPDTNVYVPMRVVRNGPDGSEVLFTVFRLPSMTDSQYEADIDLVLTDLTNLKRVLESGHLDRASATTLGPT